MESMIYILSSVLAFLGLVCGMVVAYIAKEELKLGKKYFKWLQYAITVLVLFFTMAFFNVNLLLNIGLIILFLITIKLISFPESYLLYPFFAVMLYLVRIRTNTFVLICSLIFLYGFPTAAVLVDFRKKNYVQIAGYHASFIVLAFFLLFL